jgi:hypothetical protein
MGQIYFRSHQDVRKRSISQNERQNHKPPTISLPLRRDVSLATSGRKKAVTVADSDCQKSVVTCDVKGGIRRNARESTRIQTKRKSVLSTFSECMPRTNRIRIRVSAISKEAGFKTKLESRACLMSLSRSLGRASLLTAPVYTIFHSTRFCEHMEELLQPYQHTVLAWRAPAI